LFASIKTIISQRISQNYDLKYYMMNILVTEILLFIGLNLSKYSYVLFCFSMRILYIIFKSQIPILKS